MVDAILERKIQLVQIANNRIKTIYFYIFIFIFKTFINNHSLVILLQITEDSRGEFSPIRKMYKETNNFSA